MAFAKRRGARLTEYRSPRTNDDHGVKQNKSASAEGKQRASPSSRRTLSLLFSFGFFSGGESDTDKKSRRQKDKSQSSRRDIVLLFVFILRTGERLRSAGISPHDSASAEGKQRASLDPRRDIVLLFREGTLSFVQRSFEGRGSYL